MRVHRRQLDKLLTEGRVAVLSRFPGTVGRTVDLEDETGRKASPVLTERKVLGRGGRSGALISRFWKVSGFASPAEWREHQEGDYLLFLTLKRVLSEKREEKR